MMKYYTFNIACWGSLSPCYKQKAETVEERINVWKCKINSNGKIVSSKLIESNLYTLDQVTTKSVYLNASDCCQMVRELNRQ